jgi:hypothetical protein
MKWGMGAPAKLEIFPTISEVLSFAGGLVHIVSASGPVYCGRACITHPAHAIFGMVTLNEISLPVSRRIVLDSDQKAKESKGLTGNFGDSSWARKAII